MIPVILAGGKGERFWPVSRKQRPKQFLCLDGSGQSLLQATAHRLLPMANGWENLWVITASHLEQGVRDQLPDLPAANLLVESEGRDTAPAVIWSTLEVARKYGEDEVVGFFPADHWIGELDKFKQTLNAAEVLAVQERAIATLGIAPTYAATGYGYIEQGERIGDFKGLTGYRVSRFTEKPDQATAEKFLASQRFSWNSGMFIFQAGVALAELEQYAPDILAPLQEKGPAVYPTLPKLSIDYALMEKTQRACVLPVTFSWDDLGDWNAIERLHQGDQPNVELGQHVGRDTSGAIVYNTDDSEVVVTIGLEDVVIVRDGKATLIVNKHRTQEIKKVLKDLQADPRYADLL
ncbi:MAG: mannose-1-phosphate guanylyltransferase [Synechococcales bacterium]|nr:mannose-1-phosphate guanylyltransferase [Synechococcales bacterium]